MNALELTVYPPAPPRPYSRGYDVRAWERDRTHERVIGQRKRLTSAELAAEWHANEVWAWRMTAYRPEFYDAARMRRLEDHGDILRRFATLPHYDEADDV